MATNNTAKKRRRELDKRREGGGKEGKISKLENRFSEGQRDVCSWPRELATFVIKLL